MAAMRWPLTSLAHVAERHRRAERNTVAAVCRDVHSARDEMTARTCAPGVHSRLTKFILEVRRRVVLPYPQYERPDI
jgi:hypothetical protein